MKKKWSAYLVVTGDEEVRENTILVGKQTPGGRLVVVLSQFGGTRVGFVRHAVQCTVDGIRCKILKKVGNREEVVKVIRKGGGTRTI